MKLKLDDIFSSNVKFVGKDGQFLQPSRNVRHHRSHPHFVSGILDRGEK